VADAARELDDLHASGDLAQCVREDLAVLGREDLGELVLALVQQLAEREHDRLALRDGGVAPLRPRPARDADRVIHVCRRGEPHVLLHGAERGVEDLSGAVGCSGPRCAVDPVIEDRGLGLRRGRGHCRGVCHVVFLLWKSPS
jgi:hypothetical protein